MSDMNMSHFNDTQVSMPTDSGGQNAFDNRSQSRFRNQQFYPIYCKFDFKKPRFSERNPYPRIPLSVNRSKLSIPFKSELCLLFQRGRCYYGENCHFAHKMSEIRKSGFKTVATDEHLNEDSDRNAMWRMKVCYFFSSGMDCPYGDKCHFLHKCVRNVRTDVGLYRESCALSDVNGGSEQIECGSLNVVKDYDKLLFYKTKPCMKWERFGSCPYGVKCTYAHGKAELQGLGSCAELGRDHASCEIGINTAKELEIKSKRRSMKWNIDKISQIYADWMDDRHNFHVSPSEVRS